MADADAAVLVEESTLKDGELTRAVRELLGNSEKIKSLEKHIEGFARAEANREIWEQILEITGK